MYRPAPCFTARWNSCRAFALSFMVAVVVAAGAADSAAARAVPAEFQGKWVPTKATCESPAAVMVAAERLTLVNGKDEQALNGVEMAGPGYFPLDYRGIMAVLITEFSGHQPATVIFNVGEKKGVAQIEFAPVMRGKPNPQITAYNARISKLNLTRRFPLDKAMLRKCAGAAPVK